MTLHWWMHWFWVTAQLAGILASPLPSTTQAPMMQPSIGESTMNLGSINERVSTPIDPLLTLNDSKKNEANSESVRAPRVSSGISSFRVAKAINLHDSPTKANTATANNHDRGTEEEEISPNLEITTRGSASSSIFFDNSTDDNSPAGMIKRDDEEASFNGDLSTDSNVPDSRITWLLTTDETPERRRKKSDVLTNRTAASNMKNFSNVKPDDNNSSNDNSDNDNDKNDNNNNNNNNEDLTVLPLRIEGARFKLIVNSTRTITAKNADGFSTRTFNGSEDIEIDQELAEPRLSATATSIFQDFLTAGISESTRLSRARNAFTSDFRRDQRGNDGLQTAEDRSSNIDANLGDANDSVNREIETSSSPSVIDIAAITGSCLATVLVLSTMASLGFIMYRRKYLNPPQTLNSDKCSNPDSSGYIDDSTIRDNSEEMYSLDNDSFLNSLEAMTIQNYWTDSVKHTKL